jgi:hypothetical protein
VSCSCTVTSNGVDLRCLLLLRLGQQQHGKKRFHDINEL